MPDEGHYVPGGCNIGRAEIRFRKAYGWILVLVTLAAVAVLLTTQTPRWWRLLLALPAAGAAVGLWQGYAGFCAAYGLRGVFNFGPKVGDVDGVEDATSRRMDRWRAMGMAAGSGILGLMVAVVAYAAPA